MALANCAPHGEEIILKGPSGIITPHGPIGPTGPAHGGEWHDSGEYHGEGAGAHYYVPPPPPPQPQAGYVAFGHHGVEVKGPLTVPAIVSGPSGKVYAKGLYGVPNHHHHY